MSCACNGCGVLTFIQAKREGLSHAYIERHRDGSYVLCTCQTDSHSYELAGVEQPEITISRPVGWFTGATQNLR